MAREWILSGVVGVSMGLGMLAMPSIARADDAPANTATVAARATPPPPPAAATGSGCAYTSGTSCPYANGASCPYASGGHHCCCSRGGLRYGVAAVSLLTLTTAVALHVASLNLDADVTRMYDARDPNHSMARSAYADLAQLDGQRQAMQNWAIGLYIGGGVLTALSVASFVLPAVWRRRAPTYVPTVAFGPTSAAMTFQF